MNTIIPFAARRRKFVVRPRTIAAVEAAVREGKRQQSFDQATRAKLEILICSLIEIVDRLDGDPDLEDGTDAEGLTDDNGIGDEGGLEEQLHRRWATPTMRPSPLATRKESR
jgi:hypothetical protein